MTQFSRRGIKSQVETKLIEMEDQLRAGKSIFFTINESVLMHNTLRAYIYSIWASRRFSDATLPNVTTKEVVYGGKRAVEVIPRSTAISVNEAMRNSMGFDQGLANEASKAITNMGLDSATANRGAWMRAAITEAFDLVAVISKVGGIPAFSPESAEGVALIAELKA